MTMMVNKCKEHKSKSNINVNELYMYCDKININMNFTQKKKKKRTNLFTERKTKIIQYICTCNQKEGQQY